MCNPLKQNMDEWAFADDSACSLSATKCAVICALKQVAFLCYCRLGVQRSGCLHAHPTDWRRKSSSNGLCQQQIMCGELPSQGGVVRSAIISFGLFDQRITFAKYRKDHRFRDISSKNHQHILPTAELCWSG